MRILVGGLLLLVIWVGMFGCRDVATKATPTGPEGTTVDLNSSMPASLKISASQEERWIVRFRDGGGVRELAESLSSSGDVHVRYVWETGRVRGFSAVLTPERVTELRGHPEVRHVREVTWYRPASNWGLARVNQRELSLSGT